MYSIGITHDDPNVYSAVVRWFTNCNMPLASSRLKRLNVLEVFTSVIY
jgi:hypothetical protein